LIEMDARHLTDAVVVDKTQCTSAGSCVAPKNALSIPNRICPANDDGIAGNLLTCKDGKRIALHMSAPLKRSNTIGHPQRSVSSRLSTRAGMNTYATRRRPSRTNRALQRALARRYRTPVGLSVVFSITEKSHC
jgi:hypothetical protein